MAVYSDQYNYIFFANPNTASKAIAKTLKEKLDGKRIPGPKADTGAVKVRPHHCTYTQLVDSGLMTAEKLEGLFKFTGVRNPYDQMVSKYVKHCQRLENNPEKYPWAKEGASEDADFDDDDDDDQPKAKGKGKAAGGKAKDPSKAAAKGKAAATAAGQAAGTNVRGLVLVKPNDQINAQQADFLNWLRLMDMKYSKVGKMENGPLEFLAHADYVIRFEALQDGFAEVVKRIGAPEPVEIVEFNITKAREEAPKKKKSYKDYYTPEAQAIVAKMFGPVIERFGYQF